MAEAPSKERRSGVFANGRAAEEMTAEEIDDMILSYADDPGLSDFLWDVAVLNGWALSSEVSSRPPRTTRHVRKAVDKINLFLGRMLIETAIKSAGASTRLAVEDQPIDVDAPLTPDGKFQRKVIQ